MDKFRFSRALWFESAQVNRCAIRSGCLVFYVLPKKIAWYKAKKINRTTSISLTRDYRAFRNAWLCFRIKALKKKLIINKNCYQPNNKKIGTMTKILKEYLKIAEFDRKILKYKTETIESNYISKCTHTHCEFCKVIYTSYTTKKKHVRLYR